MGWYTTCQYRCVKLPRSGFVQRVRNGCRGRIADMTVPEALRVDTDEGIKPAMAFLALLCECKPGKLP